MTRETDQVIILGSVIADHELLALNIKSFRRLFMGVRTPDATQQFADIQHLITQKISEHFADEENRVFPLLLAAFPGATESQIIADLSQEHADLLAKAEQLNAQFHRVNLTKCTGEIWAAMRDFFTNFESHAAREDQLFERFTNFIEIVDTSQPLNSINANPSHKAQTLESIATRLVKTGDINHAQAVFTQALKVANTIAQWANGRPLLFSPNLQ